MPKCSANEAIPEQNRSAVAFCSEIAMLSEQTAHPWRLSDWLQGQGVTLAP